MCIDSLLFMSVHITAFNIHDQPSLSYNLWPYFILININDILLLKDSIIK